MSSSPSRRKSSSSGAAGPADRDAPSPSSSSPSSSSRMRSEERRMRRQSSVARRESRESVAGNAAGGGDAGEVRLSFLNDDGGSSRYRSRKKEKKEKWTNPFEEADEGQNQEEEEEGEGERNGARPSSSSSPLPSKPKSKSAAGNDSGGRGQRRSGSKSGKYGRSNDDDAAAMSGASPSHGASEGTASSSERAREKRKPPAQGFYENGGRAAERDGRQRWELSMLLDDSWENGTILKAVLSDVMQTGSAVPGQGAPGHFDAAAGATGGAVDAVGATVGGSISIPGSSNVPVFDQAKAVVDGMEKAQRQLLRMKRELELKVDNMNTEMLAAELQHERDANSVETSLPDCFQTFHALDKRVGMVARTAVEVGDRLQTADTVHKNALETITLIEALQQLTRPVIPGSGGDAGDANVNLPEIIKDESRPTEAAAMIEKLKQICEAPSSQSQTLSLLSSGAPGANDGTKSVMMMKALENLRHCSNELENRLLLRFDEATEQKDLSMMKMCATSLVQFSGGSSLMKRFVMSRDIFKSVDHNLEHAVEKRDASGDGDGDEGKETVSRALAALYREFKSCIADDAAVVRSIFVDSSAANQVMEMLVERVIEQRVAGVIEFIATPPAAADRNMGSIRAYLRVLDDAYQRTEELGKTIKDIGCGGFDVEGAIEALFGHVRDSYIPFENNLLADIMDFEFGADDGTGEGDGAPRTFEQERLERVLRSTEEAISRCDNLFNSLQVGHVVASLYETLVVGISRALSRSINLYVEFSDDDHAGGGSHDDHAGGDGGAAGDAEGTGLDPDVSKSSKIVEAFQRSLLRVQVATSSFQLVYRFYGEHVKPTVYNLTSAMMRCHSVLRTNSEESETKILAHFEELLALLVHQAESLLEHKQLASDFLPDMNDENSAFMSNTSTVACRMLLTSLLEPVYRIVHSALDGDNREAFLVEIAIRLQHILLRHITKFTFSAAGGLQLKRDINEYHEFVKKFTLAVAPSQQRVKEHASSGSAGLATGSAAAGAADAPVVAGGVVSTAAVTMILKKYDMLTGLVNVFIVAPDSLASLVEGQLKMNRKDVMRYVMLRSDYKSEKRKMSF